MPTAAGCLLAFHILPMVKCMWYVFQVSYLDGGFCRFNNWRLYSLIVGCGCFFNVGSYFECSGRNTRNLGSSKNKQLRIGSKCGCYRCMQPTQQQGLRIPPFSFDSAFWIRMILVSAFLPDVTQQIHSLRASGVISSQVFFAVGLVVRAFRKSAGMVWGILVGVSLFVI